MTLANARFTVEARRLATYLFNGAHQSGSGLVIPNGPPGLITNTPFIALYLALCRDDPRPYVGPGGWATQAAPLNPLEPTTAAPTPEWDTYDRVAVNRYTTQWLVTVDPGGNPYVEVTNVLPITFPAPGGTSVGVTLPWIAVAMRSAFYGTGSNLDYYAFAAVELEAPIVIPAGGGPAPSFPLAGDLKFRFNHQA